MKWLQQRKIVITGEGYYAPPTLLMEEGTERRRRRPLSLPVEVLLTTHTTLYSYVDVELNKRNRIELNCAALIFC